MKQQSQAHPSITASLLVDHLYKQHLRDWQFISYQIGYDGAVYVLAQRPGSDFPRKEKYYGGYSISAAVPTDFRVLRITAGEIQDWTLPNLSMHYAFAQPLRGGEVVLVCPRCRFRPEGMHDRNAAIFDLASGCLLHDFVMGDGIASVQAVSDGTIWAGYFDEGIFGNYGWGWENDPPLGQSGLVGWDSAGVARIHFDAQSYDRAIADCYALNVASAAITWCYIYTDFSLMRLEQGRATGCWNIPISGSRAFAVHGNRALFAEGYRRQSAPPAEQSVMTLYALTDAVIPPTLGSYGIVDEVGQPLLGSLRARGSMVFLLDATGSIYQFDIQALPS